MKCAACGGTSLVEGVIVESGSEARVSFIASDNSALRRMLGIGRRPVRAHGCTRCGHLQLSVEFSENDLARYQQFEGEQPSLIERLGEDESPKPKGRKKR